MKKLFMFMLTAVMLALSGMAQDSEYLSVQIGNNTGGDYFNTPFAGWYGFTYSLVLYTPDDLGGIASGDEIQYLSYHFKSNSQAAGTSTIKIYLFEYDDNTFTGDEIWNDLKQDAVLVYDGSQNNAPSVEAWVDFMFTNPYTYQGGNLCILTESEGCAVTGGCTKYNYGVRNVTDNPNRYWIFFKDSNPPAATSSLTTMLSDIGNNGHSVADVRRFYTENTNVTCIAPSGLSIGNIDLENGTTVTWNEPNGGASSYEIQFKREDQTWNDEDILIDFVSSTDYVLDELAPVTTYNFRVRNVCGSDDFSSWRTLMFTTPCDNISSFTYTWDFESNNTEGTTDNPIPACWQRPVTSSSYPYVYSYESYANSGSKSLYAYPSYGTRNFAVLTPVAGDINELQLSLYARGSSGANLTVGIMSNPSDTSTFVPMATFNLTNNYELYDIPFNSYTGEGLYPALAMAGSYTSVYVDDVTLDYIPACSRASNIAVTPDAYTATLTWSSTGSDHEVYLKKESDTSYPEDPYTGAVSEDENGFWTITIDDLEPATAYTCYVKTVCDDNSELTSSTVTFITSCVPVESLPVSWNFDGMNTGGTSSYPLPPCWQRLAVNDYGYPYIGTTYSYSGAKALYFYDYYTNTYAVLPELSEDFELNTLQLSFYVKKTSSSSSSYLEIGVMTDTTNLSTFTLVETIPASDITETFELKEISLATYQGTGKFIAIRNAATGYSYSSTYIDDVKIDYLPACSRPVGLSAVTEQESATLSWSSTGEEFTVYYKSSEDNDYNEADATLDEDGHFVLSGLTHSTTYTWYVVPVCGDDSPASATSTFTTQCIALTEEDLPYQTSFEEWGNYEIPACWTKIGTGSYCTAYVNANATVTGSHLFTFYMSSGTYAVLPPYNGDIRELSLDVFVSVNSNTYANEKLEVGILTDLSDTASFEVVQTFTSNQFAAGNYAYEEEIIDFADVESISESGIYYVALKYKGANSEGTEFIIDDLSLEKTPSCSRATGLAATPAATTAELSWTSNASEFTVYYKKYNEDEYTPVENVTESPYTLTDLEPSTAYQWYVVAVCGDGTNPQSSPKTFNTLCAGIVSLPQSWDFETNNTEGTASYPLPACWERTGSTNYPYVNTGSAHGGTHALYFYNYSYSNTLAVFPPIDTDVLPIESIQLSFFAKLSYGSYGSLLDVGVMTDPSDASTFTTVETFELTSSYPSEAYTVTFAGQTAPYIAFRNRTTQSYDYDAIYIDDVLLGEVPACLPVTNLSVSGIGETTATISWNGLSEEGYTVTYYADGEEETTLTVEETSVEINTLTSSTHYTVSVAPVCTEGSVLSRETTFSTACPPITSFPYLETFNSADFVCWTRADRYCSSSADTSSVWSLETSSYNNILPVDGTQFAFFKPAPQGGSSSELLVSPIFDLASLATPTLSLDYKVLSFSSYIDSIAFYYKSELSDGWTLLSVHAGPVTGANNASQWDSEVIILPNPSSTYQIAIKGISHWGYGAAVDNVRVYDGDGEQPEPVEPIVQTNDASSVSETSATLNGTLVSFGNQSIISRGFEYKTLAATDYIVETVITDEVGMSVTVNNLLSGTTYTYRAFATTANGTQYGDDVEFTTLGDQQENPPCTPTTETITATVCYGESYEYNGVSYSTSGTHTLATLTNVAGCDSTVILNLTVRPQNASTQEVEISSNELPYQFGSQSLTAAGTYTEVFEDANGCDSTVTLTLTVTSGLNDVVNNLSVSLYPNPTNANATLSVKGLNEDATIIVTDQQGKVISTTKLAKGSEIAEIETTNLASGVYYVRIQTANAVRTEKLIKK